MLLIVLYYSVWCLQYQAKTGNVLEVVCFCV